MERLVMRKSGRSGVVYLFIASLLMVFVLAGGAWAEKPNDPNSYEVDKPGDGPPAGSSVLSSSTAPLALAAASSSSNTKTFRTDTGPELDWYQPCNGGDRVIDFYINVNNVDISSVTSATLTLAVWDVDFNCGTACSGVCERDTVYINGNRLMTPGSFLTGANSQWSTVTFNVDSSWIVDGDNYIKINIDTLSNSCWCVTCDWGELTLVLENTPEIEDIEISPDNPETTKDVTFTAKLKNMTGYEVVKIAWSGDIQAGEGNPSYKTKPAAGTHGKDKNVIATLTYKETATNQTGTHTKSKKLNLFFDKDGDEDGNGTPNWFEYWKKALSLNVSYVAGVNWGSTNMTSGAVSMGNNSGFGPDPRHAKTGIDCFYSVATHELQHRDEVLYCNTTYGSVSTVPPANDNDGDKLPNERDPFPNTVNGAGYGEYAGPSNWVGDWEFNARQGENVTADACLDWANPGKQTTGVCIASSSVGQIIGFGYIYEPGGAQAEFTGTYTDYGRDTDGDGLYDYLTIEVELDVTTAGTVSVIGSLEGTGHTVWTMKQSDLNVGIQTVKLDFDGQDIRRYREDGPYSISLRIDSGLSLDHSLSTYSTSPYGYLEFDGAGSEVIGNFAESTPDDNGNGLFDTLDINVDVEVVTAGDITLEAYLYTSTETPISYGSVEANLPVGQHTLTLSFAGMAIRQSRVDGPYTLRSLALFEGEDRTDFIYDAYETSAYSYTDFEVGDAEFTSASTFSDYGIDLDSDGLYDVLRIELAANILQTGPYAVVGRLFDSEGNSIDDVTLEVDLTAGQQTINLDFSGIAIWLNRENGPYELRYAFLYDSEGSLADSLPNAYATSAYNYTQFEKSDVALTGNYSDNAIDLNSDGMYDYLRVDVEVIVANAGNYALNARLMDQAEDEIVWASTTAWLPADQVQTLQLNFDGANIYSHGVSGPYYVRDIYIYNTSNTGLSDYVYDAYVTQNHWSVEIDTTSPEVVVVVPIADTAVQDSITLKAQATDLSEITGASFTIREKNGGSGAPVGFEDLAAIFNGTTGKWEYLFDSTQLPDGYYIIFATATDEYGNEGISEVLPFSIRNWAVVELLPSSETCRAGRTMPIKFSLRISEAVDPSMPFVYNEDLKIDVYKTSKPGTILQSALFGDTFKDYRIDTAGELYITNFKTDKKLADYTVEIWRTVNDFFVDSFTFETKRK